jgi:hypothetical protein
LWCDFIRPDGWIPPIRRRHHVCSLQVSFWTKGVCFVWSRVFGLGPGPSPCLVSLCLVSSRLVLSCLSCLVLTCRVLSCLVLLVLSCLVLLVSFCRAVLLLSCRPTCPHPSIPSAFLFCLGPSYSITRKIQKADFTYPSWFSPSARALLDKILVADPETRISLKVSLPSPCLHLVGSVSHSSCSLPLSLSLCLVSMT